MGGSIALTILCPSNGGIGIRLKTANAMFIVANEYSKNTMREGVVSGSKLFTIPVRNAKDRFERGPANATSAVCSSLFSKLYSLMGTGLLHPNLKRIINTAPMGSICLRGLSVNLPSAFAVGSPSLNAVYACAYSCTVAATNIDGIATAIQYMYSVIREESIVLSLINKSLFDNII